MLKLHNSVRQARSSSQCYSLWKLTASLSSLNTVQCRLLIVRIEGVVNAVIKLALSGGRGGKN